MPKQEAFRSQLMANPSRWGDVISSLFPPNKELSMSRPVHSETYSSQCPSSAASASVDCPPQPFYTPNQARENVALSNHDLRSAATGASSSTSLLKFKSNGIKPMASAQNWTLEGILAQGNNFHEAERVSLASDTLSQTIRQYELEGLPLVIEGFDKHPLWRNVFTLDRFSDETSPNINVRNVHSWRDRTMPLKEFIAKSRTSKLYREDGETERFYGKDSECPKSWEEWLQTAEVVPEILLSKRMEDIFQYRPDNPEATIQTLMCYLGIGDTFTPCHKDLCASSGQNLMCYTERDGSSFWFMTESASAPAVAEYFREILGQELDNENYPITIQELANAPFNVYVLQQRLGDMVLVPPRSCHQVVNAGGLTIKTSWSRMTLKGLSIAYHYELPLYRRVCRPETYRVKSTIHHAIVSLTCKLEPPKKTSPASRTTILDRAKMKALNNDLAELLSLYDLILAEEYALDQAVRSQVISKSDTFNDDTRFVCDFCSSDIFQSFFECSECGDADNGHCHLCSGCYVEGRNCKCGKMKPMQCRDFDILIQIRNKAVKVVKRYQPEYYKVYDPPSELKWFNSGSRALFQAACALYSARRNEYFKENMQTCTVGDHSHEVPFAWMLKCSRCQFNACFSHILADSNVHSAEALLLHSANQNVDQYHVCHQKSKKIYNRDLGALKRAQEQGRPHRTSGYHQLVTNAIKHKFCAPVNTKFMKIGWYDTLARGIIRLTTEDRHPFSVLQSVDEIATQIKRQHGADVCHVVEEMDSSNGKASKKRKHRMYVDVPQAPYNIKLRFSSSTIASKSELAIAATSNAASGPELATTSISNSYSRYPQSIIESTSSNGYCDPNIPASEVNTEGDEFSQENSLNNERSYSSDIPAAPTSLVKRRNLSSFAKLKFKKVRSGPPNNDNLPIAPIAEQVVATTSEPLQNQTASTQENETLATPPVHNVAAPNPSQDTMSHPLQDPISQPSTVYGDFGVTIGWNMAMGFLHTLNLHCISSQMPPQRTEPTFTAHVPPAQPQRRYRGYAEPYRYPQMADMRDIQGPYLHDHPHRRHPYHPRPTHYHQHPSRPNTHNYKYNANRPRHSYGKDNYPFGKASNGHEPTRLERQKWDREPNINGQRNQSQPQKETSGSIPHAQNPKAKVPVDLRRRQEKEKSKPAHTLEQHQQRRFLLLPPSEDITPPITQAKPPNTAAMEERPSLEHCDHATGSESDQASAEVFDLGPLPEAPSLSLPSMDIDQRTSTPVEVPTQDSQSLSTDNPIYEEDEDWEMNYEALEDSAPHPPLHFRTDGLSHVREENDDNGNADAMYDNPWSA